MKIKFFQMNSTSGKISNNWVHVKHNHDTIVLRKIYRNAFQMFLLCFTIALFFRCALYKFDQSFDLSKPNCRVWNKILRQQLLQSASLCSLLTCLLYLKFLCFLFGLISWANLSSFRSEKINNSKHEKAFLSF